MIPVSELNSLRQDRGFGRRPNRWTQEGRIRAKRLDAPPGDASFRQDAGASFRMTATSPEMQKCVREKTSLSLAVSVASFAGLEAALEGGATRVYFGGESYRPFGDWSLDSLRQGIQSARKQGVKAVISLPRIVAQRETEAFEEKLKDIIDCEPDGFLIRNVRRICCANYGRDACMALYSTSLTLILLKRWKDSVSLPRPNCPLAD